MRSLDSARKVLVGAEQGLRAAMSDALAEPDYMAVASIARLAESVSALIATLPAPHVARVQEADAAASVVGSPKPGPKKQAPPPRAEPTPKVSYPRYLRDGDRLVKVGWSKKHKGEYEHRAPRPVVTAVADVLGQRVKPGRVFQATDVLPVHMDGGVEVPSYQSYLVLGWLQDLGVMEKKGRDGYVLRERWNGSADLEPHWQGLAEKPV